MQKAGIGGYHRINFAAEERIRHIRLLQGESTQDHCFVYSIGSVGVPKSDGRADKETRHLHGNSTSLHRLFCVSGGCNGKRGVLEDERTINCGSIEVSVYSAICGSKGRINALKFHTTSNEVNWNCTLSCGVEETEVVIAGKLIEEKKFEGKDETGRSRYSRNMFESPVESMVNGWNGLVDGLLMRIGKSAVIMRNLAMFERVL
ncbi:hypothetical protein GCK72_016219 [Caenorhabditis remanei]|uniref:Uncharacterized protein n=1 Tax=Caenorhabditis remanei TaxID=31234 RepID=A0A6A5GZM3_CAERE|nr:hypothetical protein GCK72_016219 [Caenorhabditis remanei]KAF1759752.1 hypothetical protein GCK72_016219 [Caenorhabditis remanei]